MKTRVLFEMETSAPDDFLTLLWLSDHPDVELLGVVVTPGMADQMQLVRWALDKCGREDVAIGSYTPLANMPGALPFEFRHVSGFHYKVYGEESIKSHPIGHVWWGAELMYNRLSVSNQGPATVLTGAPPKNFGACLESYGAGLEGCELRWVLQGGFAGDNLVEPAHRLAKFNGRTHCPSFNPGGAHKATLALLADKQIFARRLLVSKNVCHGVTWTQADHAAWVVDCAAAHQADMFQWLKVLPYRPEPAVPGIRKGLQWLRHGLECYLRDKGEGKAMHDLVAATCVLDESVCSFVEVEVERVKGEWGAHPVEGTGTWISVAGDKGRFLKVLAR